MVTVRLFFLAALLAGCGAESEADRLESEQRRDVLRSLIAEVEDPESAPALLGLFEHPDAGVRYAAAAAHWRLTRSEQPGLRLLLDGIVGGDEAAVRALRPGDYPAAFVARLQRKPPRLRCVQALGAIEAKSAVPFLLEILGGPATPGSGLRTEAAWSLFRIDPARSPRSLAVLVAAYRDGNVLSRGPLAEKILAIGRERPELLRESVEPLQSHPDDDVRAAAEHLLERATPR